MTVGEFSRRLLRDANHLDFRRRHVAQPLIDTSGLFALDLEILAGDACVALHNRAAESLGGTRQFTEMLRNRSVPLPQIPSLADWEIVKAVGRMRPSQQTRDWLIACLYRKDLAPEVYLAAGSALTRWTDKRTKATLKDKRKMLNQVSSAPWGDRFLETVKARQAHEKNVQFLQEARSRRSLDPKDIAQVTRALTTSEPLTCQALTENPARSFVYECADIRQALARSLVAISANLACVDQPWNTYRDTAFRLDILVQRTRMNREEMNQAEKLGQRVYRSRLLVTEQECEQIDNNIRPILAGKS